MSWESCSDDSDEEVAYVSSHSFNTKRHIFSILNTEDNEAELISAEAFKQIKYNLGKCLHAADLTIAIKPWMVQLKKYIRYYDAMFPQDDYLLIVRLILLIFSTRDVDGEVLAHALSLSKSLFKFKYLRKVPKGKLHLDWRLLYANLKHLWKKQDNNLRGPQMGEDELNDIMHQCSLVAHFVPGEEIPHIWEELRCGLHASLDSVTRFQAFEAVMPIMPCYHAVALSTWVPYIMKQLHLPVDMKKLLAVVWLILRAVLAFGPLIDMNPHLSRLMDLVMRSLPLGRWPHKATHDEESRIEVGRHACLILTHSILSHHKGEFHPDSGMPLDPLACLLAILRRMKPFLHSQLKDDLVKRTVGDMLQLIASQLYLRMKRSRSLATHISFMGDMKPEQYAISSEQVDLVTQELLDCSRTFLYHQQSADVCVHLARLRPSMVIPEMLQEHYLALETLHETPARLLQSLRTWHKIVRFWAVSCSDPNRKNFVGLEPTENTMKWMIEGKRALFPFIESLLPLISVENMEVSKLAMPLFIEIGAWFPLANYSTCPYALDCKNELSEDECELLASTSKFDDYLVDFMNRIQDFFLHAGEVKDDNAILRLALGREFMMLVTPLTGETRQRLCRSLFEFYLREMLSIASKEVFIHLMRMLFKLDWADSLAEYFYSTLFDRIESHIKERHHLHFNGKLEPYFSALLGMLCELYPRHLRLCQDRLLLLLRRLYAEKEPCVCDAVGHLLGNVIQNVVSRGLIQNDEQLWPSGVPPWFRSTWSVFISKEVIFGSFRLQPAELLDPDFGEKLLHEFVFADVKSLESMLSVAGETTDSSIDDMELHAVVTRLETVLVRIKVLVESGIPEEEREALPENPYAPYAHLLMSPLVGQRLVRPLTFPQGQPVLPLLRRCLLKFWRTARVSGFKNVRALTFSRLQKLTEIVLHFHYQVFHSPRKPSYRSDLSLACPGLVTLDTVVLYMFDVVMLCMRTFKPVTAHDPDMKELVELWCQSLCYTEPPVTSLARYSLNTLLTAAHPSLLQHMLTVWLQELTSASSHEWSHEQTKRVVEFLASTHNLFCQPNPWLFHIYLAILTQLLTHPVITKSHEMTNILASGMKSGFHPRYMPHTCDTVRNFAAMEERKVLANDFLPSSKLPSDEMIVETERLVTQRLTWMQQGLTQILLKTDNLQSANSLTVAALPVRYLVSVCVYHLLPHHLEAFCAMIQSKQKVVSKHALLPVAVVLRHIAPRAKKLPLHLPSPGPYDPPHNPLLYPPFRCTENSGAVLQDPKAYSDFVQVSTMPPFNGHEFYRPDSVYKVALQNSQLSSPESSDLCEENTGMDEEEDLMVSRDVRKEMWHVIRDGFSKCELWSSLEDMVKADLLGHPTNVVHNLSQLFNQLLKCYGRHFLNRILTLCTFMVGEMEQNQAFYHRVGAILPALMCGTMLWPREERHIAMLDVLQWLQQPHHSTSTLWQMLKWDIIPTVHLLPLYQTLFHLQDGTTQMSQVQRNILLHYAYVNSVCHWRAWNEREVMMRQVEKFLLMEYNCGEQWMELYSVDQRETIFRYYVIRLRLVEGSRWHWTGAEDSMCLWVTHALLPALAHSIALLLCSKHHTELSEKLVDIASQWGVYVRQHHPEIEMESTSSMYTYNTNTTTNSSPEMQQLQQQKQNGALSNVRHCLMILSSVCGGHNANMWRAYPLLAELLPSVAQFPTIKDEVERFMKSRYLHVSTPSDNFDISLRLALLPLREHGNWNCKKMFLLNIPDMMIAFSHIFFNEEARRTFLTATMDLLQDPHDAVRDTAKSSLTNMLRSGFVHVVDHLQPLHVGPLEEKWKMHQKKAKRQPGLAASPWLEWSLMAAHSSVVAAFPNELQSFTPASLLRLAEGSQSRDRHVAQMTRQELCNFKRTSSAVWPKLAEVMSVDDFSLVNECALSGVNYYV